MITEEFYNIYVEPNKTFAEILRTTIKYWHKDHKKYNQYNSIRKCTSMKKYLTDIVMKYLCEFKSKTIVVSM